MLISYYANKKSSPRLPSWQPSLIFFNIPIESGSIIKPCTLKHFQVTYWLHKAGYWTTLWITMQNFPFNSSQMWTLMQLLQAGCKTECITGFSNHIIWYIYYFISKQWENKPIYQYICMVSILIGICYLLMPHTIWQRLWLGAVSDTCTVQFFLSKSPKPWVNIDGLVKEDVTPLLMH